MNKEIKKALDEIDELKKYLKRGERLIQPQIDRDGIRRYLKRTERSLNSALNQIEENEKAMRIIIDKRVNIIVLKRCKSVEEYNADCNIQYDTTRELTIIEFILVKNVVEKYGR